MQNYSGYWIYCFFAGILLIGLICSTLLSATIDMGTYGSDALYYYRGMISDEACTSYYGYGWVCLGKFWLNYIFPGNHFIGVGLLSIIIYLLSVHLIAKDFNGSLNKAILNIILFLNGVIIWVIARGLKEALIFLSIAIIYAILRRGGGARIFVWVPILIYASVKPYGEFQLVLVLVFTSIVIVTRHNRLFGSALVSVISVVIAGSVFYLKPKIDGFLAHADGITFHPIDIIVNSARFIVGPGPFRSLEQIFYANIFEVSNTVGDVLIFTGSLIWWLTLFYISINLRLFLKFVFRKPEYIFLGVFILVYVATYAFIDNGSVDTRHRAIMYFITAILVTRFNDEKVIYHNPNIRS